MTTRSAAAHPPIVHKYAPHLATRASMSDVSGAHMAGFDADDQALANDLVLVGQRDAAALRRLYDATAGRLMAICVRITGTREAGEDVLQEVFIKVWHRAGGYDRERARPISWLATIARNCAIDTYRAQLRRKVDDDVRIVEIVDEAQLIDQQLIEGQDGHKALSLIDGLPALQRDQIRNIYFQGLSYAELSERYGEPVGTIKSRVHRALTVLNRSWNGD